MSSQLIHIRAESPLLEQLDRVARRFGSRQRSEVIRRCLAYGLREIEKDLKAGRCAKVMGAVPLSRKDTAA